MSSWIDPNGYKRSNFALNSIFWDNEHFLSQVLTPKFQVLSEVLDVLQNRDAILVTSQCLSRIILDLQ